ncbi:hypothetical protein [Rhizobium sp. CB3060]|uniref:hypothetical protein n=1 Tax=Rhizobium sp. CB3060 TaxID=3138255 RepID=UPI004053BC27
MTSPAVHKDPIFSGRLNDRLSHFFGSYSALMRCKNRSLGVFIGFAGILCRPFVEQEIGSALGAVDRDRSAGMSRFQHQSFIPPLSGHGIIPPQSKLAIRCLVPMRAARCSSSKYPVFAFGYPSHVQGSLIANVFPESLFVRYATICEALAPTSGFQD